MRPGITAAVDVWTVDNRMVWCCSERRHMSLVAISMMAKGHTSERACLLVHLPEDNTARRMGRVHPAVPPPTVR